MQELTTSTGERVTLRAIGDADLVTLHRWCGSQLAYGDFDEPSHPTLAALEEDLRSGAWESTARGQRLVATADHGAVGFCNFCLHPWDDWIAMLGVIIAEPGARGRGVGTAAHRLAVRWIFEQHARVEKIEAVTDAEHTIERRTLTRVGFSLEGVLRRRNKLRGAFRDMAFYGLLRPASDL